MRQLGIRTANAALFVLCCFLLADVINKIGADLLLPTGEAAQAPLAVSEPPTRSWDERKPILQRNLFGSRLVGEPVLEPEPGPEQLEKTELPLELLGTIASEDPTTARATIWDKGEREHQVLRVGDRLKHHADVQLARIDRRRVVLLNGEVREELRLEDRETAGQDISRARSPSRRARGRKQAPRRPHPKPSPDTEEIAEKLEALEQQLSSGQIDEEDLAERLRNLED